MQYANPVGYLLFYHSSLMYPSFSRIHRAATTRVRIKAVGEYSLELISSQRKPEMFSTDLERPLSTLTCSAHINVLTLYHLLRPPDLNRVYPISR